MTVYDVLTIAGISREDIEYGEQYNLCHASMYGGLGIRCAVDQRVKDVLIRESLAPINTDQVHKFLAILRQLQ